MGQVTIRFWNQKKVWSVGTEQGIPCLRAEDFWLTAARNVLKLVVKSEWKSYSIQAEEEEIPGDKQPKKQEKKSVAVSPEFVDEALCACKEHLSNLAHTDIDKHLEAPLYLSPEGWSLFLQRYYQVVQHHVHGPPGRDAEAGGWQPHDDEGRQVGGAKVY